VRALFIRSLKEDATADQLIDVIEGNRRYVPALYVLNKIDQITVEELDLLYRMPFVSTTRKRIERLFLSYSPNTHRRLKYKKRIVVARALSRCL
jgi:ribosome-interacting GTPase 1